MWILPESAGRTQKPTETKPEESMLAMKNDILRKWETVKYQEMTQRPLLPKIKKDRRARDTIDTANKAIKEIKEGIDGPLTNWHKPNCIRHCLDNNRENRPKTKTTQSHTQKNRRACLESKN